MDIKLKNNLTVVAWLILFTFGLSALSFLLFHNYFPDQQSLYEYIIGGICALLVSIMFFKRLSVLDSLGNDQWYQVLERIPIDIALVVVFVSSIFTLICLAHVWPGGYPQTPALSIKGLLISTILVTVTLVQMQSIIKRSRNQALWQLAYKNSLVFKINNAVRESFSIQATGIQLILLLGVIFASGFGMMMVCVAPPAIVVYAPLFVVVTIPVLVIIYRHARYLNHITLHTTRLVQGKDEPDLLIQGRSPLAMLAANINALNRGVQSSLAAQAKSERLKAELITNVSHDLRTPLTSVITYTELLKRADLTEEDRTAYIEIIDRKSKRLKVLIDDLFEVSKMASGSIELVKEQVDVVQLLVQALAEHDEQISQSSLQFRVTKPDVPVHCVVDGPKLWRVFDNLIENILKYALDHSRVFIFIKAEQTKAVITFKNVTKYELSENIDELFERFKRGDTSRHTEGSGLGLAIAKSIIDLHGGTLDLAVDGDLFKATVTLACVQ